MAIAPPRLSVLDCYMNSCYKHFSYQDIKTSIPELLMLVEFIVSNVDMEYGSIYSRPSIVKIVVSRSIQLALTT